MMWRYCSKSFSSRIPTFDETHLDCSSEVANYFWGAFLDFKNFLLTA